MEGIERIHGCGWLASGDRKVAMQVAVMYVGPWLRKKMHHCISYPLSTFHSLPGTISSVQDPEFFSFNLLDLWSLKIFSWGKPFTTSPSSINLDSDLKYSPFGKAYLIFKSCKCHCRYYISFIRFWENTLHRAPFPAKKDHHLSLAFLKTKLCFSLTT